MKKIISLILVAVMLLTSIVTLASCGGSDDSDNNADSSKSKKINVYSTYELTAESYAFAVAKENTALKESANELLAELESTGKLKEIINSFFDGNATFTYTNPVSSVPTGDDRDNYLVVATNAYFPPFEYYVGNKLTGVDMKIASLLAEKLGKTLYIYDMEFDAVILSVKQGKADIGMAGMTVNEERLKTIDFTNEYYESAQVIAVREDDTVFADCKSADAIIEKLSQQGKDFKVGTQNATTGYMYTAGNADFGYDGFKNLTCKGYTTGALAMRDLANGNVDAVILDKQPAIMIAKSLNK